VEGGLFVDQKQAAIGHFHGTIAYGLSLMLASQLAKAGRDFAVACSFGSRTRYKRCLSGEHPEDAILSPTAKLVQPAAGLGPLVYAEVGCRFAGGVWRHVDVRKATTVSALSSAPSVAEGTSRPRPSRSS
jgi:hypothetical protein